MDALRPEPNPAEESGGFYRYETADGKTVIVDSKSKLPQELREVAEHVKELPPAPVAAPSATAETTELLPAVGDVSIPKGFGSVDPASFGLGFGSAALLMAVVFLIAKGSRLVLKVIIGVALIALVASAYLGLLRRSTGQGGGVLATPDQIVDDAKKAVKAAEERQRKQQEMLDELSQEGK